MGSAKQCINDVYLTVFPNPSTSENNHKQLSDTVSSSRVTTATEVLQEGTASNTHINVANTKMAMTRCCTTVNPSIPHVSTGMAHKQRATMTGINKRMIRNT